MDISTISDIFLLHWQKNACRLFPKPAGAIIYPFPLPKKGEK
jgi:hypothetical protein